jgi:type III restriction enzyme
MNMELKEYQKKTLDILSKYLESLYEYKLKNITLIKTDPELSMDFPKKAWERSIGVTYNSRKNSLGEPLPDFYMKIPTGGGKTLLACHAIDENTHRRRKNLTGMSRHRSSKQDISKEADRAGSVDCSDNADLSPDLEKSEKP